MRLALFEPDIAGNVGAVMRLAACFGTALDLIEPMGFPWGDKAQRRSAMDYGDALELARHADFDSFVAKVPGRLLLFTTRGAASLYDVAFEADDTLLFGSESRGAPDFVHICADLTVRIPLAANMRSLNLAVSAGIGLAEALRQTEGFPS
jgi:tRNA (cytidine/uridine-2'-O-)-methyltransferase